MLELDVITNTLRPVSIIVNGTYSDGTAVDLQAISDIEVVFGAETYTLLNNPDVVVVESSEQLDLLLHGTSETKSSHFDIKIFSSDYPRPLGYPLTSACIGNLSRPTICR